MRSRSGPAVVVLAALLAACSSLTESAPEPTRFSAPLLGRPLEEVFYGAYIDEGSRDYACGQKFYAGHRGTDILLRNFRVQDSGVTVVAAAAGRVTSVHDGEPDRNAVQDVRNQWNFVTIAHPDGITSTYGHLRRGSIVVSPGQEVAVGRPLGLVGSSGFSNWPHLHFEVQGPGRILDPWQGACAPGTSRWLSQLGYQNAFRALDMGIADRRISGAAELLERPADAVEITGAGEVMSFWVELYNVRAEVLRAELHNPSGDMVQAVNYPGFITFSTAFALVTYPVTPGLPAGEWAAVFSMLPLGGVAFQEVARKDFTMVPPVAAVLGSLALPEPEIRVFTSGNDTRRP